MVSKTTASTLVSSLTVVLAIVLATSGHAVADEASAKEHFEAGRKLQKKKRYAEACREFELSQKAFPSVGALLNIGECREKQTKLASAWRAFREAARIARDKNDRKRAKYARQRIASLEERLSYIELVLRPELLELTGLDVRIDGRPVAAADLGRR